MLPSAGFWDAQPAYDRILGYTPRLLLVSFLAYLVGEFSNSFVLPKMEIATKGRWLWARTIASTLIGQGLDSCIFITIAFAGIMPTAGLMNAVITQWLVKSASGNAGHVLGRESREKIGRGGYLRLRYRL